MNSVISIPDKEDNHCSCATQGDQTTCMGQEQLPTHNGQIFRFMKKGLSRIDSL